MLKKKRDIDYRKAFGGRVCCKTCAHRKYIDIHSCARDGGIIRQDWRCEAIGLQSSRRYAIRADHVCSEFHKAGEKIALPF